ncbi:MAG TPA: hypothetical protein DEP84_06115, partial [Chloroflexi bacterium]|nr:hypothetical protein [Chloroflexota bacterium]
MQPNLSDPVFQKVFWDRLISVTNEQAAALIRTGFTPILRDAQDLSAGVFDARARMIAQSVTGTPGHINSMATGMRHVVEEYPSELLEPGDVLITNDPWFTSGHLNDLTVATPVFRGTTLVGFFANTCHAVDIGGLPLSADARDVYEEGLAIPIMKLYKRGEPNEDLFKILRSNVRAPLLVLGDLHAQVACNDVGGRRLLSLLDEFELEDMKGIAELIVQRSEIAMREAIAALPNGHYAAETWADGFDTPIHIKATVTVADDELIIDYNGTSPQSRYGINVPLNYTLAYTTFAVKAAISPEVPNNHGSFRPVHVTAPPGCILNAQRPAPVAARAILGHFLPGVVFRALGEVVGERAMAAGADSIWLITVHGGQQAGEDFTYTFFSIGGTGARAVKDGLATTGFPSGVAGCPAEVTESLSPIIVRERELKTDSGGAGRYRGGLSQRLALGIRSGRPYGIAATCDRTQFAAEGVAGGCPGMKARNTLDTGEA